MIALLLVSFLWLYYGYRMYYIADKNYDIANIFNSTTHAIIVVGCYIFGIAGSTLYYISITYYLVDTLYEFINLVPQNKNKPIKIGLYNMGILIHHLIIIISINYLYYEETNKRMYYAFYLAELSNFPMYVVKYLKKVGYQNTIIVHAIIIIEIIGYIYLRLYLGGIEAIMLLFEANSPWLIIFASFAMLIISAVWTYKLIRQIIYSSKKIEI